MPWCLSKAHIELAHSVSGQLIHVQIQKTDAELQIEDANASNLAGLLIHSELGR